MNSEKRNSSVASSSNRGGVFNSIENNIQYNKLAPLKKEPLVNEQDSVPLNYKSASGVNYGQGMWKKEDTAIHKYSKNLNKRPPSGTNKSKASNYKQNADIKGSALSSNYEKKAPFVSSESNSQLPGINRDQIAQEINLKMIQDYQRKKGRPIPQAQPEEQYNPAKEVNMEFDAYIPKMQKQNFCGIYANHNSNPHNHPGAKNFRQNLFSKLRAMGRGK